jgi:hypothetical protein
MVPKTLVLHRSLLLSDGVKWRTTVRTILSIIWILRPAFRTIYHSQIPSLPFRCRNVLRFLVTSALSPNSFGLNWACSPGRLQRQLFDIDREI